MTDDEGDRSGGRPSDGPSDEPPDEGPSTDSTPETADDIGVDPSTGSDGGAADDSRSDSPSPETAPTPEKGPSSEEAPTPEKDSQQHDPARAPPPAGSGPRNESDSVPSPSEHPIRWYLNSTNGLVIASRDIFVSIAMVALIGLVLFAISGVWPPLVAVESGSMEPNMKQGDLVLIVDNERFSHPDAHEETGVITTETGEEVGHESFGQPGNVIVFQGDGGQGTPIIHRARHHVEDGENWHGRADEDHLRGYSNCVSMPNGACPAPHDGFVTKGDANGAYDQLEGQSIVVKEEWIQGKAVARVPWLGCVRLELTSERTCFNGRN